MEEEEKIWVINNRLLLAKKEERMEGIPSFIPRSFKTLEASISNSNLNLGMEIWEETKKKMQ